MKIKIAHFFPQLLNLYGDKGNIAALARRLEWRDIEYEIIDFNVGDNIELSDMDIVLLGGGSDKEQKLACFCLRDIKDKLSEYISNNGVLIALCGGYHMLGHYYKLENETVDGLGLLDIFTEWQQVRLTGNVVIESELTAVPISGFENHSGRTFINGHTPLGKIIHGNGNNGSDGTEGVVHKNVIATNLHGPLLPKNPQLCDYLLKSALSRHGITELNTLDDRIESTANSYIIDIYKKSEGENR